MVKKLMPGVYIIGDVTSGKSYVGSSQDLPRRLKQHQRQLKNGEHTNPHLQNSYNAGHQFLIIPIPTSPGVDQLNVEQKILDEHYPSGNLFNLTAGAEAVWRGMKHTEETKQRLSEIAKERGMPRATIEAGAAARRGVPLSPEHIEVLRVHRKAAMTPEARAHLSAINKGIPHTPETIALMKEKCKGRDFTPEARAKGQAAAKKYWDDRRAAKLAAQSNEV